MNEVVGVRRYEPMCGEGDEIHTMLIEERRPFRKILADEFELRDIEPIETGGGNERDAAREQAADGTNVFAIREGVVVTYDRNVKTNRALKDAGATVLEFDGSELVRGLGGPRCMTMPLLRER
jgi:arginine deiminase